MVFLLYFGWRMDLFVRLTLLFYFVWVFFVVLLPEFIYLISSVFIFGLNEDLNCPL